MNLCLVCKVIDNSYPPRVNLHLNLHVNIRKKNEDLKELLAFFYRMFFLINLQARCPLNGSIISLVMGSISAMPPMEPPTLCMACKNTALRPLQARMVGSSFQS